MVFFALFLFYFTFALFFLFAWFYLFLFEIHSLGSLWEDEFKKVVVCTSCFPFLWKGDVCCSQLATTGEDIIPVPTY